MNHIVCHNNRIVAHYTDATLPRINKDLLTLIHTSFCDYKDTSIKEVVQIHDASELKKFEIKFNQRWCGSFPIPVVIAFHIHSIPDNFLEEHI